jgi:hypothetical protein
LVQELDDGAVEESSWQVVSDRQPTSQEMEDLRFAWKLARHVRSNAITVAKGGQSLGVGAGQMNRVGSAKLALEAAGDQAQGAVLASDGFFPFDDTVRLVATHVDLGYKRIKLKIKPGWDLEPLSAVRAAFPTLVMTADANSAYTLNDVAHLQRIDELGLDYIETDFPALMNSLMTGSPTCTCDALDFNDDGLFPDDNDLVQFLSVLAGGACDNDPNCNDIDFNNDGLFPDDSDLITFLRVLAGGECAG